MKQPSVPDEVLSKLPETASITINIEFDKKDAKKSEGIWEIQASVFHITSFRCKKCKFECATLEEIRKHSC